MEKKLKDLRYSILDLDTVNKGDTLTQTFDKSLSYAQHAEKWGYLRYWLSEHHNMPNVASSATTLLISHIAGGTKTIRVGSGGIMLPNHSTLEVAESFGTLESLFPGRIDLGLGRAPGTDGRTALVLRRGQSLMDYDFERNIRQLFLFFSEENAHSPVRAIPGEGLNIPVYILGSSTDSAHLAAKLGLPYAFAGHFAPAQFYDAMRIYKQEFRVSDYLQQPYSIACINIIAADTDEKADFLARSHYQAILNILTDKRAPLAPPEEAVLETPGEQVRNALLTWTALTFVGSPERLRKSLEKFQAEAGVDELMAYTNIYDFAAKLRSYELFSGLFQG